MYPLEFKVTSTLHCFPATVKGALEKQAEHVLNESELLAVRGAIHVHAFCLLSFSLCLSFSLSLSHTHTHSHTQSQKAWQACELSIMYVQHCIHPKARRLCGEKGLVLLLGLDEVTSAVSRLGEDCVFVLSHVRLFVAPCTVALRPFLSVEFFRQESWSELPFPTPGHLLDPGIELLCLPSEVGGVFLTTELPGKSWGKTPYVKWL